MTHLVLIVREFFRMYTDIPLCAIRMIVREGGRELFCIFFFATNIFW